MERWPKERAKRLRHKDSERSFKSRILLYSRSLEKPAAPSPPKVHTFQMLIVLKLLIWQQGIWKYNLKDQTKEVVDL